MANPENALALPFLSVVVPAYNEEERLPQTLDRIMAYLDGQDYSWELVVVDDASTDRTLAVAEERLDHPACRLLRNPRNLGKGGTVRRGVLEARGQYRLFSDADLSTPIEELGKLLAAVEGEGYDVAIGSRALKESNVEVHQPFYRESMGKVFNLIVQALTLPGIKDTQCGFKLFRAEAAEAVFARQENEGWAFDVEVLMLARRLGFKVAEVPVRWLNSPATRVVLFRDSLDMFLDVVRLRFRMGRLR